MGTEPGEVERRNKLSSLLSTRSTKNPQGRGWETVELVRSTARMSSCSSGEIDEEVSSRSSLALVAVLVLSISRISLWTERPSSALVDREG